MKIVIDLLKKIAPVIWLLIKKFTSESHVVRPVLQKIRVIKYDDPLNPKVIKTIQYKSSPKRNIDIGGGKIAKDISGEIKVVEGNFKRNKRQWIEMLDFSNKLHYKKKDNKRKVDLNSRHSKNLLWYGGVNKFRVNEITAPAHWYGSSIEISILDKKNNEICNVLYVHCCEINSIMFDYDRIFKPGIYIGRSDKKIGVSTGPHLHLTIDTKGLIRKDLYRIMKGE